MKATGVLRLNMCATMVLFVLLGVNRVYGALQPQVAAQGAALIDMESGRLLWGKNQNEPMAMASTTKIMTALIALEQGNINDKVTVSKAAAAAPKVKMYLQPGEQVRLYDLLLAMMLQSYNDSAVAVAEHIGGSVDNFCLLMNLRAKEIGCLNTVFETPNGIDKGNHHSTPYDMALITREALKNPAFRKLVATPSAYFTTSRSTYSFVNKDRLLKEYQGALGVKTGFTNKAGQCFAGAAQRGDEAYVAVVLASGWGSRGKEQKWIDTKALLNYGFNSYSRQQVLNPYKPMATAPVARGKEAYVTLYPREELAALVADSSTVSYKTTVLPNLRAPIKKGEALGTVEAYEGQQLLGRAMLVAHKDILPKGFCYYMENILHIFTSFSKGNVV